jgi:hypothetical protein
MKMYLQGENGSPAQAIREMAEVIISSVLSSGYSVGTGGSGTQLPADSDLPAGIGAATYDDDDFFSAD